MKKISIVMTMSLLLVLVLAASTAWAVPTININDLGEGNPVVTSSGFTSIPVIGNPIVARLDEFANVTGTLFSDFVTPGAYGIRMLEPAFEGGGVSDFAILAVSPELPIVHTQPFNLTFLSDGFDATIPPTVPIIGGLSITFADALTAFDTAVRDNLITESPSILEDGSMQNLFNYSGLVVNAQSDVVPLPPSAILFGTGLLGLAGWRRFRKG